MSASEWQMAFACLSSGAVCGEGAHVELVIVAVRRGDDLLRVGVGADEGKLRDCRGALAVVCLRYGFVCVLVFLLEEISERHCDDVRSLELKLEVAGVAKRGCQKQERVGNWGN